MEKKNITIALVIPHYPEMFSTFYTMEIIQGVSKELLKYKNVELFVHIERPKKTERKTVLPIFNKDFVSGILFADIMGNEKLVTQARKKKIPFIILNYFNSKTKDNCIGIDNVNAVVDAVDYLVKLGHEKIATITGKLKAQAGLERLEGFKKGLKKHNLKLNHRYMVYGDWSEKSGYEAMKKLLSFSDSPSAVFVSGDEMAFGAIRYIKEHKLGIPNDISIVGFDDVILSASDSIKLTTVKQPLNEVGSLGLKYMLQIIKRRPKNPIKVLLRGTKLIMRQSTGVPKKYYW